MRRRNMIHNSIDVSLEGHFPTALFHGGPCEGPRAHLSHGSMPRLNAYPWYYQRNGPGGTVVLSNTSANARS